jgi:excisionase family DNA binding protein
MNAPGLNLPTDHDANAARAAIDVLRGVSIKGDTKVRLRPEDSASEVEVVLPAEAIHLLVRVLTHMANGSAVTVLPVQAELTTQHAADLLGVSRPYLVRLLDEGKIPFHKVGTHRRVRAVDVMAYQEQRQAKSKRLLDDLTEEAQELDLGY